MNRFARTVCALLLCTLVPATPAQQPPTMPKIVSPLPPPPDHKPAARVVLASYRYDDLLWENDRTAHRIYGHALEAVEPPSGSGIDAWGKNVPWPFADRQLRTGDQHAYHGEGLDFYNVGTGRGAGGLGVWFDNKLWTSRNFVRHRILKDGPDVADFVVAYAPWPVNVERKVWETRRFTLPVGTSFTRIVSTLHSDSSEPLTVGIGIGRRTVGTQAAQFTDDRERGVFTAWSPEDGDHGAMAIALRIDPRMIVDVRNDSENRLVLINVQPGKPFVYYSGATWSKGITGIRTHEEWTRASTAERLTFELPPDSPTP